MMVRQANFNKFLESIDARIIVRKSKLKEKMDVTRDPSLPVIDASKFSQQVSDLAETLINQVEREGPKKFNQYFVTVDTGMILRQMIWTYNLVRWVNADDTRSGVVGYRQQYSFVILPLVRTMIDGFYNCTALLDDPSRSRSFRISGYYRYREALMEEEVRYKEDSTWKQYLNNKRTVLEVTMINDKITKEDLDNKKNIWPLLGKYLNEKPETKHKILLKQMTLGPWKEYSSISHASFDALLYLFPHIAKDKIPHDKRANVDDWSLRDMTMHYGRAAGILLCLLTEIQTFFKFEEANIDKRLSEIWEAMIPIYEIKELYDFRYKNLLK